ncbi:MAG: ClpXP protease specificity-enhancing factor [Burkholderiaceae bacterium]|nr:ClpXP protease specificity-enhancing factor [Burkholderiaceae bacterium]
MNLPVAPSGTGTSTRPYLIRALHEWCSENGYTPYIAVFVDPSVRVPAEYVKNNEIVLNVGYEATNQLQLGNEFIEFKARFGGTGREIVVPVSHVIAIYARENGQGMAFPAPTDMTESPVNLVVPGTTKPSATESRSHKTPSKRPTAKPAKSPHVSAEATPSQPSDPPESPSPGRPSLKRVK